MPSTFHNGITTASLCVLVICRTILFLYEKTMSIKINNWPKKIGTAATKKINLQNNKLNLY